jgi:hypothetical protein
MSKEGIKLAASIFSQMQEARQELFRMGTHNLNRADTNGGNQDILLGQLLETGKEAMKDDFLRILGSKD